jgi:hypothetical protein
MVRAWGGRASPTHVPRHVVIQIRTKRAQENSLYENDITAAVDAIKEIRLSLEQPDKAVNVFCNTDDSVICIQSNYYREVLYNLEHCIHHQALIKVALLNIQDIQIAEGFGVAPSTLQYRQQCAQ